MTVQRTTAITTIGLAIDSGPVRRRLQRLFTGVGWRTLEPQAPGDVPRCDVLVTDMHRLEDVRTALPTLALVSGTGAVGLGATSADLRAIVDRDDLDGAFLTAVQEILAGHGWVSPTLIPPLLRSLHRPWPPAGRGADSAPVRLAGLTARENEVVALVARGMSNGEIAAELHVAESTVKFHMSNILQKTGLRDRSQLAARLPGPLAWSA
ncbi:response regulator transcription factor [Streptomyces sp. JJ38]|uniref:LuxR family transcriptional regulator n=1 Tax=Streptomyces sp. JJ38 TaxID=2738128 RepID=UPI0027DEF379|nr:response regulator transcription factor [Streptomyces sp. JJ38]